QPCSSCSRCCSSSQSSPGRAFSSFSPVFRSIFSGGAGRLRPREVPMSWKQLFATKSLEMLDAEARGENRLRRILGPVGLTSLGVGAIIGAGIFVMTGEMAANAAGPGVLLSFLVAGTACAFAAFCYAEFASLAPVAGSAYTYAYATLGELFAWIIG